MVSNIFRGSSQKATLDSPLDDESASLGNSHSLARRVDSKLDFDRFLVFWVKQGQLEGKQNQRSDQKA